MNNFTTNFMTMNHIRMPAAFDAESMVLARAELETNLDLVSVASEII